MEANAKSFRQYSAEIKSHDAARSHKKSVPIAERAVGCLVMLPRMIDIARAKLPGGTVGEYQIGRGMSGMVLKHFRFTADEFVGIVAQAEDDDEVLERLPDIPGQSDHSKLSSFLKGLTVADVPDALRAEFQAFYGQNLPADRLVLDVLEEDDARSFPQDKESARPHS